MDELPYDDLPNIDCTPVKPPIFRSFEVCPGTSESGELQYLPVSVYENKVHVAELELDQSWFSAIGERLEDDWTQSDKLLNTFPTGWLESLDDAKDPNVSKPAYFYVVRKEGGDSLARQRPSKAERDSTLGGPGAR